jgi:hypothetical protein
MERHPLDPVSVAFGIVAVAAGFAVALGDAVDWDAGGSWWLAAVAALVGLAIIPWRRRRPVADPAAGAPATEP